MRLKKSSGLVEVLTLGDSEVHAVRPDKSTWDEYSDAIFEREGDEVKVKSGKAIEFVYTKCVKKLVNVEDENGNIVDVVDTNQIVDFLKHLVNTSEGRKLDSWLLCLAELNKPEQKN